MKMDALVIGAFFLSFGLYIIQIMRASKPRARKLVAIDFAPADKRISVAKGVFVVPNTLDASQLFMVGVAA